MMMLYRAVGLIVDVLESRDLDRNAVQALHLAGARLEVLAAAIADGSLAPASCHAEVGELRVGVAALADEIPELVDQLDESLSLWLGRFDPASRVSVSGAPLDAAAEHIQDMLDCWVWRADLAESLEADSYRLAMWAREEDAAVSDRRRDVESVRARLAALADALQAEKGEQAEYLSMLGDAVQALAMWLDKQSSEAA